MSWRDRRWRIFYVLTAMYVIAYFYRVSAAVIAGDLARDLSLTPDEVGRMSAALFYAFAFTQLPLGPLLDRIGPRRIIFVLGLVTAGGAFLFASATG
ncbi:MAG: MFS transporter, partial [Desulfuromonadales bacterium]|nr:MFS transporter [Desulfuromonadales bacterium]NIR34200.1 MFS transporter [Desulfuromonadales bacterium]NIS41648.1 MFS transporter [Desulfuromonadales bacterium]